jgi:hypothetical protein
VSITVTPQPDAAPPRFQVSVATPGGQPITALTFYRTAGGRTEATRFQPGPGPASRITVDSEAPWDSPVVFAATVTYGSTTETYTAAPAFLSPAFPWLIHPTTPALSRCLDQDTFTRMGVVSIGAVSRAATTTRHSIIGAKYPIVTKTGPRSGSQLQMQIATTSAQEHADLWALLDDQTPLLIRVPDAWEWDWEDGYYDVADASADRFEQYGPTRQRTFTLALARVEAPAGDLQPQRTWADVKAGAATWADLARGYNDWTSVLTDTRR